MIIGLGHYSRTGKDTFVDSCIHEIKRMNPSLIVKKLSFAWKLKEISTELFTAYGMQEPGFYDTDEGAPYRDVPLDRIEKTPVQIWIEVGNKMREVYVEVWRDYVLSQCTADITFIPDCRFSNEISAVKTDANNVLIKMMRPGRGPRDSVSDRALLEFEGWDYLLGGDDIADVHSAAWEFANWLSGTGPRPERDRSREAWLAEEEAKMLEESCELTTA